MDKQARDKRLTEAMGECWHEWEKNKENFSRYSCTICGLKRRARIQSPKNNDFSTWLGFGKLWEWAEKQEWWGVFIDVVCWPEEYENTTIYRPVEDYLINPDRFADALYEFLKQKEGE